MGCSGQESVLLQCSHSTTHNCGHSEDAGVSCSQPGQGSLLHTVTVLLLQRTTLQTTVLMEHSDWLEGSQRGKGELKSASVGNGEQFAMITGGQLMHRSLADNWDMSSKVHLESSAMKFCNLIGLSQVTITCCFL